MKHLKRALVANLVSAALIALGLLVSSQAGAATCFWVGTGGAPGGGTWSTANTTNWASATNGTNGTCAATGGVPKQTVDTATFDSAANGLGGGTVTVDSSMIGATISVLNASSMNGTLDFSVNFTSASNGMTFSANNGGDGINFSGTGTRTIKMGSGTYTLSSGGTWDLLTTTNLNASSNFSSATIILNGTATASPTAQGFVGGGQTYGSVTINGRAGGQGINFTGSNTFSALTINGPVWVDAGVGLTQTITNLTMTGTISQPIIFGFNSVQANTTAINATSASINYAAFRSIVFGTAVTANNSWSLGNNTNLTVNPPSSGGGIIGGGL